MGLWDTVKKVAGSEVDRAFMSRPDEFKSYIVWRWPDTNIRKLTQCTVEADEVAVFVKEGKVAGTLGPGRHTLDGASIPFLSFLVDKVTGGDFWMSEVYFVSTRQIHGVKFGGEIGRVKDPETELRVRLRAFGEVTVKVSDPGALITNQTGLGAVKDNIEQFKRIVSERVMLALSDDVGEVIAHKKVPLDVVLSGSLKEELIVECKSGVDQNLQGVGLSVVAFSSLNINPDEADYKKLQEDAEEMRMASREARKAQLMNQVEIQKRAQLSQLAGGYQNFAQSEMMLGAGAGLAKGGESSGNALAGAGLGMGFGMAGMLGPGMQPGMHPGMMPGMAGGMAGGMAAPAPAPAAAAAPAGGGMEERLAKLKNLLDKGLISQPEFDAKRAKILEEI